MNMAVSFIVGFIGIGIMVTVHELGHFIAAKASSITVEVFAFGWGKSLYKWIRGETEFRINMFPVGGYCRMKGSDDLERALSRGEDRLTQIEKGSLFAAHPLKRMGTYLAGPLANIFFALLVFVPFFLMGYDSMSDPNRIIVTSDYPALFSITEGASTPAAMGGLRTGDVIVSVDGVETPDFQRLQEVLASRPAGRKALFLVEREQFRFELSIEPKTDPNTNRVLFGVTSYVPPVVASVEPLSPESVAGLTVGDRIVAIQGKQVDNSLDIAQVLRESPSEIDMQVMRETGGPFPLHFIPYRNTEGEVQLNFSLARTSMHHTGNNLPTAMGNSIKQTFSIIGSTFAFIPTLFTGTLQADEVLAGPLRLSYLIGDMTNSSMHSGIYNGLRMVCYLLGVVSVSLAVANLLPIPALDGGLVLLTLIELIRGKPLPPRLYMRIQMIGTFFIIGLMLLAVISDIRYFL